MQFGIFGVGDISADPTTGYTQSEAERISNMIKVARRADEVGLDVFALGEHHNPPFVMSSPPALLAHIAALTERIILSTAVTLITTNDPVKIAEDYAMVQHVAKGRLDLTMRGQLRCPACGCRVIVRSPQVLDRDNSGRTKLALVQPSVWSRRGLGELTVYICSKCGLVEWYVKEPQELLKDDEHFEVFEGPDDTGPYR